MTFTIYLVKKLIGIEMPLFMPHYRFKRIQSRYCIFYLIMYKYIVKFLHCREVNATLIDITRV